jgi:hypothetical protein
MDRTRLPRMAAATSAWMTAVALLFTAGGSHRLAAQQSQSATTPAPQSERHGYSYGVASVVVPTTQGPVSAPTAPTPQLAEDPAQLSVHLDQLMTLREWDATGVARLRPEERAALETWVQKYRAVLLDSATHAPDETSASGGVANGEIASSPSQPVAPPTPAMGYSSAFAVPAAPPSPQGPTPSAVYAPSYSTAPNPQPAPTYAPGYGPAPQQPINSGPPAGYTLPAPAASAPSYSYPSAQGQATAPGSAPSYQPNYQPSYQGAPVPQPAPPQNGQPTYGPQSYQGYAQPSVVYPTAPSAPQFIQSQSLAPTVAAPYTVAVPPAATPAPAGAVVKTGLSVQQVHGGNRFVSLTDGSMWDVYAGDRGEVGVWRAQDPVYVRLATTTLSGGYDREIVNASRNVLVRVKFAGQLDAAK